MLVLPDMLLSAVAARPDHGVGFVMPDRSVDFRTFPELLMDSLGLLAGLQEKGLKPADILILSLDRSKEIIPVLWACFLGGIIPALLQPPVTFTEYNPAAEKADKVFRKLKTARVILSHDHFESWLNSSVPAGALIDITGLPSDPARAAIRVPEADDLALIQFSSGSTGDPKGVMLTHRNILVNIADITEGLKIHSEDNSVSWMPLYHDMGLIGFHLTPLRNHCAHYFIEPVDFVKNPLLWLEMLSVKQSTITGCPNFGQVLVNRYLSRRKPEGCDLSAIRVVFNGAEPISVSTMTEFLHGLEPFGLNPAAMFPAYGMAEATLAVTFPPLFTGAAIHCFDRPSLIKDGIARPCETDLQQALELVNLGSAIGHCRFRITGDNDEELEEGRVGHVLVAGENITRGYYNDPEATSAAITDGWLRTGDLGFRLGRDLFVTGRAKDIIFINGTNYYAHDLETIALQVPDVAYGKIVIAGWFDEAESRDRLIVFLVGSDNPSLREAIARIKTHFLKSLGLATDIFIAVKSNEIPRTSSGKIQRYKMVERFRNNGFEQL